MKVKSTPLDGDRVQGQQKKHVTQQRQQDTREGTSQHHRKCKRQQDQHLHPSLNKGLDHGEESNLGKKRRLEVKRNEGGCSSYHNDTQPEACKDDDNPCNYTENIAAHDSPNWEPLQFDEEDNVGSPSPLEPQEEDHNLSHDFLTKQGIGEEGKKLCKNGNWSTKTMELAFEKLDDGYLFPEVSAYFKIPSSLRDHYFGITTSRKRGPQGVLTAEEEKALVVYLDEMIALGHPLNQSQLKLKVAEITQERVTPFKNGIPGESWLKRFKNRHPQFITRVAQGLEMGRAKGLCPTNVATFYQYLETMYTTKGYAPDHIWNVDESRAQSGKERGKVLARKGQRHVQTIIPNGTKSLTMLSAINASGETIPNFYIFRGWHRRRDYIVFCEPFATMAMQRKGWMNNFLFS